jgi:hypothetical protein
VESGVGAARSCRKHVLNMQALPQPPHLDFRVSSLFYRRSKHSTTCYPLFTYPIPAVQLEYLQLCSFAAIPHRVPRRLQLAICRLIMESPRPILCAHGGRLHEAGWSSDATQTLAAVSLVNHFFRSW